MNRKHTGLFIGLLGMVFSLNAQIEQLQGSDATNIVRSASEVAVRDNASIPIFIEYQEGKRPLLSELFNQLKSDLQLDNQIDFELRNSSSDQLGFEHDRYFQTYNGHKIEMAWLNVHTKTNRVVSVNGRIVKSPKVNLAASLNEKQALERALSHLGAETYKWEIGEEERHLKLETKDPSASYYPSAEFAIMNTDLDIEKKLSLCYKFNIYAQKPIGRYNYFVNASNGKIEYVETLLHTGNANGTAVTAYSGTVPIVTDSVGSFYRLRETGRGLGIETYDMNTSTNYGNAVDFTHPTNFWSNFTIVIDRYATDAHFGTEMTYDYFSLIHNRNSIDGNGFPLRSYVHYDINYVNAFWDGQRMTYGDGNSQNTPLTTLDICGHEVAHGLTNFTSHLIYANESGALNESFSDIFGVAIENYARPNNWNWLMGEDIGGAFRSLSRPNAYGDPDTYDGLNWVNQNCIPTAGNDRCGVHTNSGVQNYWFYLLTQGGNGTNDIGDAFNVNGIGIIKAAKVAFRNNTVYLGRSSDYQEARFYGIKSAVDLFGACSPEVESVTNAWHAVGVGNAYSPGVNGDFVSVFDTSFCSKPANIQFNSNGSNVISFIWDFGDGSSSTLADPSHFYANYGSYDVQLIVDGAACGSDTILKRNYIVVDSSIRCSYLMGTDRSSNECSGNVYDNGGLNGNYLNNGLDTFEISVNSADQLVLYINDFNFMNGDQSFCNRDYLEIFDGDVSSNLIGKYCGNNLPPDSIVTSTNKLTLILSTDSRDSREGFQAYWQCINAAASPIADFYSPLDTVCSAEVSFASSVQGAVNSWSWDFGDGRTSSERNPTHFYERDGSYSVQLIASNSFGSDTVLKNNVITIQRLADPNVLSDTTCIGGRVKLAANGSGTLQWFRSQTSTEKVFEGDTLRLSNLTADTAFYVHYEQKPSAIIGTPFIIPGNTYFSDSSEAMYFDVFEPMILESVILKSNKTGLRRIDLRNSNGNIIASKTLSVSAVPSQVQIGFVIYPGSNYSLSIGSSIISLELNSTGASYPYTIGNSMALTGSSLGPNAYPFFYYWTVRPLSCFSSRKLVEGRIDTSCVLVGNSELISDNLNYSLYPNPSKNNFRIGGIQDEERNLHLEIFSLDGKLAYAASYNRAADLMSQSFGSELPSAVYFIRIVSDSKSQQFKWIKTE